MMKNYSYTLSIVGISVLLNSDLPLERSEAFKSFEVKMDLEGTDCYQVDIRQVSKLSVPDTPRFCEEGWALVWPTEEGISIRGFRESVKKSELYAVSRSYLREKKIEVQYLESAKEHFQNIQRAFNHIFWENILLNERKLMLHASYVKTPFGGLAFSGPSGIGKSTQAELWCRYGEGSLINGDKLIFGRGDTWTGYGSPYAGSSNCYVNASCEVRGIFFLKQGTECSLRPLSVQESFKRIFSGLTVNRWDMECVEIASNLVKQLAEEVSAYEFTCTPDENAVSYLRQKLQEGEMIHGKSAREQSADANAQRESIKTKNSHQRNL